MSQFASIRICILIIIFLSFDLNLSHAQDSILGYSSKQTSFEGGEGRDRHYLSDWISLFYTASGFDCYSSQGSLMHELGISIDRLEYTFDLQIDGFTLADIDLDGDFDLFIFLRRDRSLAWLENAEETQEWIFHEVYSPLYEYKASVSSDFDGNGLADIAVASREDGLMIIYQCEVDVWTLSSIGRNFYNGRDLEVYDLNADGKEDIIGVSWVPSYISWWENPGSDDSEWSEYRIVELESTCNSIIVSDLDGNGVPEILAYNTSDESGFSIVTVGNDSSPSSHDMLYESWVETPNCEYHYHYRK